MHYIGTTNKVFRTVAVMFLAASLIFSAAHLSSYAYAAENEAPVTDGSIEAGSSLVPSEDKGALDLNKKSKKAKKAKKAKKGTAGNSDSADGQSKPKAAKPYKIKNGTYFIQVSGSSKKVIGVAGSSTSDGANVKLVTRSSSLGCKWVITKVKKGTYTIRNVNSGKFLSVRKSAKAGANVVQLSGDSSKSRKWKIQVGENGGINIVSAKNPDVFLGVKSVSTGSSVRMVKDGTVKGSKFLFLKTSYPAARAKMERKIKYLSSKTKWLIAADTRKALFVGVYKGYKGHWVPCKYFPCSPGAPGSPSATGIFRIGGKGYVFGSGFSCYYWSQYNGNYLFHSVLYNQGTRQIQDGRLGMRISHGCIRLAIGNAKWIYQNIPSGTTVLVY